MVSSDSGGTTTPMEHENTTSDGLDSSDSDSDGPMQPDAADPVTRCVVMLRRAKTDTERFAGLLMVTKLIKAETLEETTKKKLLDAVGLGFLGRLLRTTDSPEGCPPFMFKSIALTILSSFITSCLGNPTIYNLIPILSEIITSSELYEADLALIKDAYECLKSIASDKSGRKAIIDFEAIGALVDAYVAENFCYEEALEILLLVIAEEGSRTWEDEPESFTKLMNQIAIDFASDHSETKFQLCEVITEIFSGLPENVSIGDHDWKAHIHKGLADIILSKLGREQRDKGLRLAGAALEGLGVEWVIQGNTKDGRGRQLLLMMVHLACIEVRMSLEDKTFQEAVASASPTTACYTILEIAINFLVNGALDLEQKQKQQLYAALKGAFTAVLAFLNDASKDESFLENPKNHLFICATIRVLGAWLAEETSANKEEVYQVLPFIIKVAKQNFDSYNFKSVTKSKKKSSKNKITKEEDEEKLPDILRFLLPGMCHLTAEDIPRIILLELELENLLFEYFKYQWDSVRSVFGPHSKGEEEKASDDIVASASMAMETLCNIFMNIVVQEPERVKLEIFYYHMLKMIFVCVPDIPSEVRHLTLCGNLSTLGLMILRHQHHSVKSSDFTIFRFVQTVVRFLWDAHNVEESSDFATLVVSTKYEFHWNDLMDLWYLGMNTLGHVLPSIPWLCDFLIESEWPQTIVATLVTVRDQGIDQGAKTAYEDLLCILAKSSKPAFSIMKERGVEQVCKNHKMEELAKVFNLKC